MNLIFVNESSELALKVNGFLQKVSARQPFVLHTSGTTGPPKRVEKSIEATLERKRGGSPDQVYLLTFDPERWAGVSVLLHCKKFECALVVPASLQFADIIDAAYRYQPTHLSLTPTMLRTLLLNDAEGKFARVGFKQVTFGGEAATQSVLDLAKRTFPGARVTHTYASTEHGDICAVSDGKEGVPLDKFKKFSWIQDGEAGDLVIDGVPTGDLWKRTADRFLFVGRKEEVINVGGNKVSPLVVEEAAIKLGVLAAKAFAVPSPLTGALVSLEYVGAIEPLELLKGLRTMLPKYACPASAKKVDSIAVSSSGKVKRL